MLFSHDNNVVTTWFSHYCCNTLLTSWNSHASSLLKNMLNNIVCPMLTILLTHDNNVVQALFRRQPCNHMYLLSSNYHCAAIPLPPFAACCLWRTPELYSPIYFFAKDLPHSREETKRYGRVHFCRLGGEQFGLLCWQHSPTPVHQIQVT